MADVQPLLIFQGADHYVSPRWYWSSPADSVVPTWDYSVVHARGPIEWIEDKAWLSTLLRDMSNAFERGPIPWHPDEMAPAHWERLLGGIVGFQMPVDSLQGKFKLNQGSSPEDRAGVIAELQKLGTDAGREMAEAIDRAKR